MAPRAAAERPLIPGERSSARNSNKPKLNYNLMNNLGIIAAMTGEEPTSKTNTGAGKRKRAADHQPESESEQPAKRARNSRPKHAATPKKATPSKGKGEAEGVTKNTPKTKSAARGRADTSRAVEAMTGARPSANAVEHLALDPDVRITGKSTAKRGSKSATKQPAPALQQRTISSEDDGYENLAPMGATNGEFPLSNTWVAAEEEKQLPTPVSLNKANSSDDGDNGSSPLAITDETGAIRCSTPDRPVTPADPTFSTDSTLTEFTSTAGDEEAPTLEGPPTKELFSNEPHIPPVSGVVESASLPHAHPLPQTSKPTIEPSTLAPYLRADGTTVMLRQNSEAVSVRSSRSTLPIKRFGTLVNTTIAMPEDSSDEDIEYEASAENQDSDALMEMENDDKLETTEDSQDDDFAPVKKPTPKSTGKAKGKVVDLTSLISSPSPSTMAPPKRKRAAERVLEGEPQEAKRRTSNVVKLRVSSNKLVAPAPASVKLLDTKPISIKPEIRRRAIQKHPVAPRKLPVAKRTAAAKIHPSGLLTPPQAHPGAGINYSGPIDLDDTGLDQTLVQISKKLMAREPIGSKPMPRGKPEVWADSRQALCETVPYFKMAHSGCHTNDRHVYSFLFDGSGHCREYTDSDVIIARAGGSMESDASGTMVQKQDHRWNEAQVQAVLNDIEHQNPLIIIAGNKNEVNICKLPRRYQVLGWYKPVACWAEKTMGKGKKTWTTIKYRFERLDCSTPPWYAPALEVTLTPEERDIAGDIIAMKQDCSLCGHNWPQVYLNGWMCLNSDCDQFWRLPSGQEAPYGKLYYHPSFLTYRKKWENEDEPYSVRPTVPDVGNVVGDNLAYINTRGICCPECGRCSHRRLFKGWRCDNPVCGYSNFPKHIPVRAPMLHQPWELAGDGPALSRNIKTPSVKVSISHVYGYKVFTYTFTGIKGKFVHAVSNAKLNRQENGPDDMFAAMQRQDDPEMDLKLERRRFGIERGNGAVEAKRASIAAARPTAKRPLVAPPRRSTVASILLHPLQHMQQIHDEGKSRADDFEMLRRDSFQVQMEDEQAKKQAMVAEDGDFMTAFSMNFGMPYKFIASGASMPFGKAPWPVRACHADLNWASKNFIDAGGHDELNELLIFAYLEGQKIEYHDDGESGLGPRIATMSLGGSAKMHMRMKQRHYVGCSKSGLFNAEEPVPGSIDGDEMFQKRHTAWMALEAIKQNDKPTYDRRRKEVPKELGIYEKRNSKASDLVTVTLNHGDIVLMEGYEIQKYLEHKVVPESCLRFALTCRTVLPEHLKPEERPSYDVEAHDRGVSALYRMEERERAKEVVVSSSGE